jgi:AcrR family transcriptional regulator
MSQRRPPAPRRAYHHGDLRNALLGAAEAIVEREGIPALTLRALARAAGVSHAAPAHHFGDLVGLLSELAAVGYTRLTARFAEAMAAAGAAPGRRLSAMGRASVGFARAHPGLFQLMFRAERLDPARPALRAAMDAAAAALRAAIAARVGAPAPALQEVAQATALWSLVHGFSVLLIDGRLHGLLAALPEGEDAETLLEAVFAVTDVAAPAGPDREVFVAAAECA